MNVSQNSSIHTTGHVSNRESRAEAAARAYREKVQREANPVGRRGGRSRSKKSHSGSLEHTKDSQSSRGKDKNATFSLNQTKPLDDTQQMTLVEMASNPSLSYLQMRLQETKQSGNFRLHPELANMLQTASQVSDTSNHGRNRGFERVSKTISNSKGDPADMPRQTIDHDRNNLRSENTAHDHEFLLLQSQNTHTQLLNDSESSIGYQRILRHDAHNQPLNQLQPTHARNQTVNVQVLESQLERAKLQNQQIAHKLLMAQEEIDKSHDQIARQAGINRSLSLQVENLKAQVELSQVELEDAKESSRNAPSRVSSHATIEVERLMQQLRLKNEGIETLQNAIGQYREKCKFLELEQQDKANEVSRLLGDLRAKEEQLEELFLEKDGRAQSTYILEIRQLQEDNQRLMQILKTTAAFKEYNGFIEDSGGQVRAITHSKERKSSRDAHTKRKSSRRQPSAKPASSRVRSARKGNDEAIFVEEHAGEDDQGGDPQDAWVPDKAYSMAHAFRKKHGNELSADLVNALLSDLNKIYREREKKQISRIKLQATKDKTTLQRKLQYRAPFDQVVAKRNISVLRQRLKSMFNAEPIKAALNKDVPAGLEMVENTLQMVAEFQQQRKYLESQNKRLVNQLDKMQEVTNDQSADKMKYMEGAVWMGKRMAAEVEKVVAHFDSLAQEYMARFQDVEEAAQTNTVEVLKLQRAQIWFLEAVKSSGFDLYERIINMLESALYLRQEASSKLTDAYSPVAKKNQIDAESGRLSTKEKVTNVVSDPRKSSFTGQPLRNQSPSQEDDRSVLYPLATISGTPGARLQPDSTKQQNVSFRPSNRGLSSLNSQGKISYVESTPPGSQAYTSVKKGQNLNSAEALRMLNTGNFRVSP